MCVSSQPNKNRMRLGSAQPGVQTNCKCVTIAGAKGACTLICEPAVLVPKPNTPIVVGRLRWRPKPHHHHPLPLHSLPRCVWLARKVALKLGVWSANTGSVHGSRVLATKAVPSGSWWFRGGCVQWHNGTWFCFHQGGARLYSPRRSRRHFHVGCTSGGGDMCELGR